MRGNELGSSWFGGAGGCGIQLLLVRCAVAGSSVKRVMGRTPRTDAPLGHSVNSSTVLTERGKHKASSTLSWSHLGYIL